MRQIGISVKWGIVGPAGPVESPVAGIMRAGCWMSVIGILENVVLAGFALDLEGQELEG